jgi:hypothetical protein
MIQSFVAYIDESGDEGFGKLRQEGKTGQSRWLSLGAAIVSADNDRFIPSWRNEIMELFPKKQNRDLHFRFLNHDQRVAACSILATKPVGICVIASNKETLIDSPKREIFKKKQHLYNYLVRFLLERITDACAKSASRHGHSAQLSIVFSRRSGTDYQSMREYLCLMRDGKEVVRPVRSINWNVLDPDNIRVENHSIRAGLQIADIFTSATSSALDPNEFGHIEPRYALTLQKRYLRRSERILDCGLTLIPPIGKCPLNKEQLAFIEEINKK